MTVSLQMILLKHAINSPHPSMNTKCTTTEKIEKNNYDS